MTASGYRSGELIREEKVENVTTKYFDVPDFGGLLVEVWHQGKVSKAGYICASCEHAVDLPDLFCRHCGDRLQQG